LTLGPCQVHGRPAPPRLSAAGPITGPKLSKLARKYRPLAPVLREFVLRPDTPLDRDVKLMIVGQLDNAEDRFAAIAD
jgi:hypothetical protein